MPNRRDFIKLGAAGAITGAGPLTAMATTGARAEAAAAEPGLTGLHERRAVPIVISTWNHGIPANESAWRILSEGGSALDAAEAGVRVTEADPTSRTVGIGGRPDAKGHVTLDACIMEGIGRCGAVAFLEHIKHPISVARKVMEETPHVMLVGEGALEFALTHGFERENLLTPESEEEWRAWLEESGRTAPPEINVENEGIPPNEGDRPNDINSDNHDTIGLLTLDRDGRLAGACTTSGAQYKLHGRVGDSPIIGAGLFVDDAVGAACATGWGEAVIRIAGSHLVVELMRHGHSPDEACRLAVERVIHKNPDVENLQVGFLALDRTGRFGAYAVESGFDFAIYDADGGNRLQPSPSSR